MPIDFVGDWCFSSREQNTTWYTLPSWTEDGHCTDILSINKYGFYYANWLCDPVNMRLKKSTGRSDTEYTAIALLAANPAAHRRQARFKPSSWFAAKAT
jgi:hypothetical protein